MPPIICMSGMPEDSRMFLSEETLLAVGPYDVTDNRYTPRIDVV